MEKRGLKFFILHALARQLQGWADFASRQIGEERPVQRNQANTERDEAESATDAFRETSAPVPATQAPAQEDMESADTDTPPAHWLARVQKDAPELLKQKGYSIRNVVTQSHALPAAQVDNSAQTANTTQTTLAATTDLAQADDSAQTADTIQTTLAAATTDLAQVDNSAQTADTIQTTLAATTDLAQADDSAQTADTGQRVRMAEITRIEKDSSRPTEIGKQHNEGGRVRRDQMDVSASPNPVAQQDAAERMGQGKEPVRTNEPNVNLKSSLERWPSPSVQPIPSPWEERSEMHSVQQPRHSLQLQVERSAPTSDHPSLSKTDEHRQEERSEMHSVQQPRHSLQLQVERSAPTSDHSSLSKTGEYRQAEMRWPSLPDEVATNSQDWEMAWQAWKRQQRLDEEQRGNLWNV